MLDTLKYRVYKFYGRTTNSFWGNEDIQMINTKNDYGKNRQKKSSEKTKALLNQLQANTTFMSGIIAVPEFPNPWQKKYGSILLSLLIRMS